MEANKKDHKFLRRQVGDIGAMDWMLPHPELEIECTTQCCVMLNPVLHQTSLYLFSSECRDHMTASLTLDSNLPTLQEEIQHIFKHQ